MWAIITIAAAAFQVGRNGMQRSLLSDAGPWGATLVRFLFGMPFSLLFAALALAGGTRGFHFSGRLAFALVAGAASQIAATAALLVAMRRTGFALATLLQQSSIPLAAVLGIVLFGESLAPVKWLGIVITTLGLAVLTGRQRLAGGHVFSGTLIGIASGLLFALALNSFRAGGLLLAPDRPIAGAMISLAIVQAVQTGALATALMLFDRKVLAAVFRGWRQSLGAGLFGSLASAGWFAALALAPAGLVRAVGVIEVPIAAAAGRHFFRERLSLREMLGYGVVLSGIAVTALG